MNREFSFRSREEAIRRLRAEQFDLLIIGGGITGAAAARDAVSRGLKVALVEKHDFASGTSSASSKLIARCGSCWPTSTRPNQLEDRARPRSTPLHAQASRRVEAQEPAA